MEPLAISFPLCSTYDLLPNTTNQKLWGYTDSDVRLSCERNRGRLRHVLSACPQLLQMYTWRLNKVLEVVSFSRKVNFLRGNKKIPRWRYWTELESGKFQRISRHLSTISSSQYSNRKAAGHGSMLGWNEDCPSHRNDCPLGRKPGGSTWAEEQPIRDTACWLRGKGLNMPCDS